MVNITDKSQCCGCTACANICAHEAITMEPDALGFLYPKVDESKCVDCGLCDKVCAFNDNYDKSLNLPTPDVYGARHKDMDEVMKSRSGAAFIAISDYILDNGGVVYGVGYKDHFRVAHKRATTEEERDDFRGSKYVQSDLTGIFKQVKGDLKNGLTVLFSGTGCQCAGLNSYIGQKLRSNLILIDIVCHSVPGPYLWRDYLILLEQKHCGSIVSFNFRNKTKYGWKAQVETFVMNNGEEHSSKLFTKLFQSCLIMRPSCSKCHFCNTTRPSDITLADLWDRGHNFPEVNKDNKGESLLLVNTEKGRGIFDAVKDKLDYFQTTTDKVMQGHLREPSKIHSQAKQFAEYYGKYGFERTMKHFGYIGWRCKFKEIKKRIFRIFHNNKGRSVRH